MTPNYLGKSGNSQNHILLAAFKQGKTSRIIAF